MSLWKTIFRPHDGTRAAIREEVEASKKARESATTRFEQTVREVLEINDRLTGRKNEETRA